MLKLFKKKTQKPTLKDLYGTPLQEGDWVQALRYDLGKSRLVWLEEQYFYVSAENGERIIWTKMIDAITQHQKVKKLYT